jgi:putative tryptophan/tyrosine transport system substrate-binding protein
MIQRRLLLLALGAALAFNPAVLRAQASSVSMRRVGVLAPSTQVKEQIILKEFFDRMRELGWIEGQNITYDRVYADDQQQRLPRLAAEMVARKPEVLFASVTPVAVAAKQATQTIPIVFGFVTDPVGIGLVKTLAHPGGNLTGMTASVTSLTAPKRVELLREILPSANRIGLLGDSTDPSSKLGRQQIERLASSLGVTFTYAEAADPAEFEVAVAKLIAERVDAISPIGTAPLVGNLRVRLIELANQKRIPVIAGAASYADAGALFIYGASVEDVLRRSAGLVDKVLKGAKPADTPVEQPNVFELVINLKAAKALGITIPGSILLRADRVID